MGVNLRDIAFVAGFTAAGVGISQVAGRKLDEIHERQRPDREWAAAANEHFAGIEDGGVTPDEMKQVADYIRDNKMPSTVEADVNSTWVNFSRKYDDLDSIATGWAAGPAFAIVGGGFFVLAGGIHAALKGGTTGLPASAGVALAASGAGLLGGYLVSEALRK